MAQSYSDWHLNEHICGHLKTDVINRIDGITPVQTFYECFCFKFIIFLLLMIAFSVRALLRMIDFCMKLYKIMAQFDFHGMFKCMLNIF